MGRNAKRRRGRKAHRGPLRPYIDIVGYVASRWPRRPGEDPAKHPMTRRRANELLRTGKVHVNGQVQGYPHFPKHQLEQDDLGRPRIMVEGYPDPRPEQAPVILGRKAKR